MRFRHQGAQEKAKVGKPSSTMSVILASRRFSSSVGILWAQGGGGKGRKGGRGGRYRGPQLQGGASCLQAWRAW